MFLFGEHYNPFATQKHLILEDEKTFFMKIKGIKDDGINFVIAFEKGISLEKFINQWILYKRGRRFKYVAQKYQLMRKGFLCHS